MQRRGSVATGAIATCWTCGTGCVDGCDSLDVVTRSDLQLDAATLRAELDLRWPDATGSQRADVDERHRLVLLHPEYDGFVTLEVTARTDLDGVFVLPSTELHGVLTSHHRTGPLLRGQQLPIDLELHPGRIPPSGLTGVLQLVDVGGTTIAPDVRVTLATDRVLECVLAGEVDGPFPTTDAFEQAVADLLAGRAGPRTLARRIEALADGGTDPGVSRLPWRRG